MSSALIIPDALREKLDALVDQHDRLERSLTDPEVLSDHRKVRDLSIRKSALDPIVREYKRYLSIGSEIRELLGALESPANDPELAELARSELPGLERAAEETIESVKSSLVNADDRAVGSVIMEVRAGTGGDEAGLWARDLLDIYSKFAARKGWNVETLDLHADDSVGGVRSATLEVSGEGVWAELAFESGVHSVKRVPATETQGRVHTSTATVAVLPEPEEVQVQIDWAKDVTEDITTAQGPGGQNVNKVATAVKLLHKPTGIEVRMQESKSQAQNKEKARRILLARLYDLEQQKAHAERSADRNAQIGTGQRSEKIRVYRYQDQIVADERIKGTRYNLKDILDGELDGLIGDLIEQETARRLAAL